MRIPFITRAAVKRIIAAAVTLAGVYVIGAGVFIFCIVRATRKTPEEMYREVFGEAAPATISDLQGTGWAYSGFVYDFRFRIPRRDFSTLLNAEGNLGPPDWKWTPATLDETDIPRTLSPAQGRHFHPPWAPQSLRSKEAYYRGHPNEGGGAYCILFDRYTGTVYFHGHGM